MDSDATLGNTLLAAEPIILLPKDTVIQLLVTSSDVIHS
jgi:heme/copper-type cytochrome/quinol oxidase subunit 2